MQDDTIAAITTVLGASSVGIIRISGDGAIAVADKVFRSKRGIALKKRASYSITYGHVIDENGRTVDESLALTMRSPHSFTGEDVVELQCHGGAVVLRKVLELVLRAGARMAEPGEFSKRAFLHGRIDLSQAEAIMDMINAKTEKAVMAAANHLEGTVKQEIAVIREKIIELTVYLEADIDFPEEDITRLTHEEINKGINEIINKIEQLLNSFKGGKIIREGLKTILIGRPNVGKSSLLNAILKEKRSIVTDVPGTTRDIIEEYYNLGGIPIVLVDTAGIRETKDIVEKMGVEKTKEEIEKADLILYVLDITDEITAEDRDFIANLPKEKILILINKHDLLKEKEQEHRIKESLSGYKIIFVSAKEGYGLKELETAILELYFDRGIEITDKTLLTNIRHKDALQKAHEAAAGALDSVNKYMPSDFISIDLKQAWLCLGEISGETLEENIIEQIFSRFCLGK